MMNWGTDPDVALYIGGPKDGRIERMPPGRQERYVVAEPVTFQSWADPLGKILPTYRYGTYEHAKVVCDGQVYSVMADKQNYSLQDISDRVLDEVMYGRKYWGGIQTSYPSGGYHNPDPWVTPQQQRAYYDDMLKAMQQLSAILDPPKPKPKKSPEEALAWLHQTEGKDFL